MRRDKSSVRAWSAAAAVVLAMAGSAVGQVRVEGIEHGAMGGASLAPTPDGALLVSGIGSSGEDGVELHCDSAFGASVSIAIDELLAPLPSSRELRIRPKGWDGTIKGSLRMASRPPDGTPGSSMDVSCDFADAGAVHIRVTARDQFGNLMLSNVLPASSVQCSVSSLVPPGGLTCGVAINTKGTGAAKGRGMSVTLPEGDWTVSGLSSAALHGVSVIGFEPEMCAACDQWRGTESVMVTGSGVSSMTLSRPRLLTFGVSSSGLGNAHIDEECDDASDCDDIRALTLSHLDTGLSDGAVITFDGDGNGGGVSYVRGCCRGHVIIMKAFDDEGVEASRLSQVDDEATGQTIVTCDASATGAAEMDVYMLDASGTLLHSSREPTAVLALACTGGPENSGRRCTCHPGYWSLSSDVPDTYVLPSGTGVAGVSTVWFRPVLASPPAPVHALHMIGNEAASPIVIRPVNDPPSLRVIAGIIAIPMEKGLFSEGADGSLVVTSPCCDDDGDGLGDGAEIRSTSAHGATVTVDVGPLLSSSGEIKIRHKGWDGLIYGTHRMTGGGGGGSGGTIGLEFDFPPSSVVSLDWEALDASGVVLASGTVAGSTLGGITIVPEPDASLLMPALMKAKEKANRTKCSLVMPDRDCDVTGLGSTTLHNVRSISVTTVHCVGCSPPWPGVDALQATYTGMPSLTVLGASLLSFDAECVAVGDATLGEVCDDTDDDCDGTADERRLEVRGIGSSGQDGVEIRLANPLISEIPLPVDGGAFSMARGNCCRGHVTILKMFDDGGAAGSSMMSSSSADGSSHTIVFDASAVGATGATLHVMNGGGDVIRIIPFGSAIGDISYVGPCDAAVKKRVSFDSSGFDVELCESDVTVFAGGQVVPGARSVMWTVDASPPDVSIVRVTNDVTEGMFITDLAAHGGEPPCAADFDGNGVREVPDIFAFLSAWFAQDPVAYNFGGQTGVPAIFAFLATWFAGCP